MNAEQAKQLNLPAILAALGHQPVKTTNQGLELWYHSPFRKDRTPSFHTSYLKGKWIWNDFGGTGGTVIDFALQHLGTSDISQALGFLAELTGRVGEEIQGLSHTSNAPLPGTSERTTDRPRRSREAKGARGEGNSSTLELISTTPISNPLILSYLTQTRRIPEPLIRRHLTEITYRNTTTNKEFFAFGLQNRAGGYEIRSASDDHPFKSVIGPRDITLLPGSNPTSGIVSLFEGTLDFLSLLAIMNLDQLEGEAIVMHSLSSYKKTVAVIQSGNYQTINLFLDNDKSGVDVAFQFLQDLPSTVNQSNLFHPHEDLNAFLLASLPEADKQIASGEKSGVQGRKRPLGDLRQAEMRAVTLQDQLQQKTDDICRAIFLKHPGAKSDAYAATTERSDSGYRVTLSIAANMASPAFREAFKAVVEKNFPAEFDEVQGLRKEITRALERVDRLK